MNFAVVHLLGYSFLNICSNNLYSSVPSFSLPNHLFWQLGTSCGLSTNPVASCNGSSQKMPASIFDSLKASNVSYKQYSNSSSGAW